MTKAVHFSIQAPLHAEQVEAESLRGAAASVPTRCRMKLRLSLWIDLATDPLAKRS